MRRRSPAPRSWTAAAISRGGERVSHLYPNDCYFAHLSIYAFARAFAHDRAVLDAGSGAGYGAAYLAERGARSVLGCELDEDAVAFSEHHFRRPNLEYRALDLQRLDGLAPASFDVIFSSNVLEHVPDVLAFLSRACELLGPDGTAIIAVPPIVSAAEWEANRANPFHLNLWTPRQWAHTLGLFFETLQAYHHGFDRPGVRLDFDHTPGECQVSEDDFSFVPVQVDEFDRASSLTVVLVATRPRPPGQRPSAASRLDLVDASYSRPPVAPDRLRWWRQSALGRLLPRAVLIAREQGLAALVRAVVAGVRKRM